MVFGKQTDHSNVAPIFLNDESIQYVHEWKYLGCLISGGKEFSFSCRLDVSSFRRSANSILSATKKPNEQVAMKLLYTFSVPILTYASEVKRFNSSDMYECHVALNNAIRRIFTYNRWESIRALRTHLGFHDLYTLFAKRRQRFFENVRHPNNVTLISLIASISHAV